MLRIRLGDQDRCELGCVEWLEYDPEKLMLSEAMILDAAGVDVDRARYGEPILDPDTGEPARSSETGRPLRRFGPGSHQLWIWCALRRAGVQVDFAALDVDLGQVVIQAVPPAMPPAAPASGSPGKDDAEASPKKSRRSARSSGTSTRPTRPT